MVVGAAAASASSPLGHSSSTSWIPPQNDPNAIHGVPSEYTITPGSIALKFVFTGSERITSPRSTQA